MRENVISPTEQVDHELTGTFLADLNRSVTSFVFASKRKDKYGRFEKLELDPITEVELSEKIKEMINALANGRISPDQRNKIKKYVEYALKNQEERPIGRGRYSTDLVPKMLNSLFEKLN